MVKKILTVALVLIALCCFPCGSLPGGAEAQAATEGFESGNFNSLPWTTGGDANWGVATGGYTGTYAAAAPANLAAGQSSDLTAALDIAFDGDITFWYRVSSADGDSLQFYIDDILQGEWTGDVPWNQATFPVIMGSRKFKWVYSKKLEVSAGRNRAWVDDIVFPNSSVPAYTVSASVEGIHGSISCPQTLVEYGKNSVCTITPADGYHLETIVDNKVDMWSRELSSNYTVNSVVDNHTISVTFTNEVANDETFETRNLRKFPWVTGATTLDDPPLPVDGNPSWSVTEATGYLGGYAVEAPASLEGLQRSYLKTNLYLPNAGYISFRYKVSSEPDADYLNFYIDGVKQGDGWSGDMTDWPLDPVSFWIGAGPHTLSWEYSKDNGADEGSDRAWIDDIVFPADAIFDINEDSHTETFETGDFTKFPWIRSGDGQWIVSEGRGHDSYFAAESPAITDSQSSSINTRLYIPAEGYLSFWYKVSSEESTLPDNGDFLRFYIDDVKKGEWSGEIPWTQFTTSEPVPAGNHTFRWEYSKDDSVPGGSDKVWIDDIVFPGAIYKPTYSVNASVVGDLGGTIFCNPVAVNHDTDSVCTITPDTGYVLATLIDNSVNKTSLVEAGVYTISNVRNDRTISVTFVSSSYVEDFETGDFLKLPWNYSGPWNVTSSSRHSGSYAAQVTGGTNSTLQATLTVPTECNMSFWSRVSSRPDVDFLKFYIDGIEQPNTGRSGEVPWTQMNNIDKVAAGRHVFKWVYDNASGDSGASTWIDDIVIPGAADLPVKLVNGISKVAAYKSTLQQAYDDAAIESADEIILPETFTAGSLTAGVAGKAVTIKGGYDDTLINASTNSTTIAGKMTVKDGTVRVESIKVKFTGINPVL
jgi:hypothetical protein